MAKIRTLKKQLSTIRRTELKEIFKHRQGKKFKTQQEEITHGFKRIVNLIRYRKLIKKFKRIQHEKQTI